MWRHLLLLGVVAYHSLGVLADTCTPQADWAHPKYGDVCEDYKTGGKSYKYRCSDAVAKAACCSCGECVPDDSWVHPQYGDTCEDYKEGGKSYKYRCSDSKAEQACCSCKAESACVVDDSWTHPQYGDTCVDYLPGGKSAKWACDGVAKKKCCSCTGPAPTPAPVEPDKCRDKLDGAWHDDGGEKFNCNYYKQKNICKKDGNKFENFGFTAKKACCACGGGDQCLDHTLPDGSDWRDTGGVKYSCSWYFKNGKCETDGKNPKYANGGFTAKKACCACGGGYVSTTTAGGEPNVTANDNIKSEWFDDVEFKQKKHLENDFHLYWNRAKNGVIQFGLLSPPGFTEGWVSLGFSPNGAMFDSDAVIAWFDDEGEAVIGDYYLKEQSLAGIKKMERQDVSDARLYTFGDRLGLVFSRPVAAPKGAPEVNQEDYTNVIFAAGKMQSNQFRLHAFEDRGSATLLFSVPPGTISYDLNKQGEGEPCDGPAALSCLPLLYCLHEFNDDQFAVDLTEYGRCVTSLGGDDEEEEEQWRRQTIFPNNGGYDNEQRLGGGMVALWSLNQEVEGELGPKDTISMAVISTRPDRVGWIGFGFSPNGEMKGTDVIVGWKSSETNTHVGDYFLRAQLSNKNKQTDKQELVNAAVIKKNGQLALVFERPFFPTDSFQFLKGDMHVIYAASQFPPDISEPDYIPYHLYKGGRDVTFVEFDDDEQNSNAAGEREQCGGDANTPCKTGLTCVLISDIRQWTQGLRSRDNATEFNSTGFTGWGGRGGRGGGRGGRGGGGGGGGRRGNRTNPFENFDENAGVCASDRFRQIVNSNDLAAIIEPPIAEGEFENKLSLRMGLFFLHWTVDAENNQIRFAFESHLGPGWLSLGFANDEQGLMIGSYAVVGWKDDERGELKEVYLNNKLPWQIKASDEVGVTDMEMINSGRVQVLKFSRPLMTESGVANLPSGPTTLLYAVGTMPKVTDEYLGYHRFRMHRTLTLYEESDA